MPAPYPYNTRKSNFTLAPQPLPSQNVSHSFAPSSTQLYSHTKAPAQLQPSPSIQPPNNTHELALQILWASQNDWKAGSTPLSACASTAARSVIGTRDTGSTHVGKRTVWESRSVGGRYANSDVEGRGEASVRDRYGDGLRHGGENRGVETERGDVEPNAFSGQIACVNVHIAIWQRHLEEYFMSYRGF